MWKFQKKRNAMLEKILTSRCHHLILDNALPKHPAMTYSNLPGGLDQPSHTMIARFNSSVSELPLKFRVSEEVRTRLSIHPNQVHTCKHPHRGLHA